MLYLTKHKSAYSLFFMYRPKKRNYNKRKKILYKKRYSSTTDIFDPQKMFQHRSTSLQKQGSIIRPRFNNLGNQFPLVTPAVMDKYYELLTGSGYIGERQCVSLTYLLDPYNEYSTDIIIDSSFIKLMLSSQGYSYENHKLVYVDSIFLYKPENTENWPVFSNGAPLISFHLFDVIISSTFEIGAVGSNYSTRFVSFANPEFYPETDTSIIYTTNSMKVPSDNLMKTIPTIQMGRLQGAHPRFRNYIVHNSFFPFAIMGEIGGLKTDEIFTTFHVPPTAGASNQVYLGLVIILVN